MSEGPYRVTTEILVLKKGAWTTTSTETEMMWEDDFGSHMVGLYEQHSGMWSGHEEFYETADRGRFGENAENGTVAEQMKEWFVSSANQMRSLAVDDFGIHFPRKMVTVKVVNTWEPAPPVKCRDLSTF
jgi:hypothetical protein